MTVTTHEFLKPPSQPGDLGVLSHYRVIDELGRGGMGFVFLAEDLKLKRPVALKVMNQRIAATPHSRRRFIREARAMAAVHHDNVATIFEVGESNQTPYMAMEMLHGSTLEGLNQEHNRLSFETIIDYARQITRGLAAAHQRGIVHRDIKPANIWIETEKDRIKILDFGLALASTPVDHLAGRGAVIGTPGYLSPEQARSEPLDDRSDLYSLGVVLYELCTGQLPLQAKSVPGQLISILTHRPTPIQELNPEIPKPLCDLVHCLLRKEPRSRPSSASVLLEQLDVVEHECHAKTEVAQAINKLQAGLTEVVKQKSTEPRYAEPEIIEELETIPDPLATPAPLQNVSTLQAPARPVARPVAKRASTPNWQSYWPVAAVAAAVLIALPVLTFLFSRSGTRDMAVVVTDDGLVPANDYQGTGSDRTQNKNQNANLPSGNQQTNRNRPNQNNRQSQANGADNRGSSNQTGQNRNQANGQANQRRNNAGGSGRNGGQSRNAGNQNRNRQNNQREQSSGGQANNNERRGTGANSPNPNARPSGNPSVLSRNGNAAKPSPVPPTQSTVSVTNDVSAPSEPAPTKWTVISTGKGRGADAMVQSGTSENFGATPSFGIRRRGNVETNHAYLRFDLASLENLREHIESAELVLTVVGDQRPIGAQIRVYAVADVGMWPEEKLEWKSSYSSQGLDQLPLLAEVSVEETPNAERQRVIRIRSRKLSEFVATTSEDLATLVLAGSGTGTEMVRFASRDASKGNAPRLRVLTPVEPPESKKKPGRNR